MIQKQKEQLEEEQNIRFSSSLGSLLPPVLFFSPIILAPFSFKLNGTNIGEHRSSSN
jgi:hypothetical protein